MRLADRIFQAVHSQNDLAGSIASVAAALQSAERFELLGQFTRVCEDLAHSKPSSLLAALASCNLPFDKMWIEWRVAALQLAVDCDQTPPAKMGCLLERVGSDPRAVSATWAWHHDGPDTGGVTVCPIGAVMSWDPKRPIQDMLRVIANKLRSKSSHELALMIEEVASVAGREITTSEAATMMAESAFAQFASCPSEVEAFRNIASHSMLSISRHTKPLYGALMDAVTDDTRARLINIWLADIGGETAFIQCAIALFNARDFVEQIKE
jgi:hypothetical protein